MNNKEVTDKFKWMLLIYFILCFYHFGTVMMTYYVSYPQLEKISKNLPDYMALFNSKMFFFTYIPAVLMVASSLFLPFLPSKMFPRWLAWASVGMALVSVSTALFGIVPIHNALPETGFTLAVKEQLIPLVVNFQLIPALLQAVFAIWMLNLYVRDTAPAGRWLFVAVMALSYYSWGTLYIESMVGYPMWLLIDPSEWLATREAVGLTIPAFKYVFLIPVYLPLLLLPLMLWKRPAGIPKLHVIVMFFMKLYVFIVTAIYFVPEIQLKLSEGYSKDLIESLIVYDFPLRGIADLIYWATGCLMFLKIRK